VTDLIVVFEERYAGMMACYRKLDEWLEYKDWEGFL